MQRRPSSGTPRSSHFFQSKGMGPGGDCLPTSYLFKEMQELAASRQRSGQDDNSTPLSALLESRRKTVLNQQQDSLSKKKNSPQQYKRLQDLPAPGQSGQVKRKPPEGGASAQTAPRSGKKAASGKVAAPPTESIAPPAASKLSTCHIDELAHCARTAESPTIVVTLSTHGWCSEFGGLCPSTNPNNILCTFTLFSQQNAIKTSHNALNHSTRTIKALMCDTSLLKITFNVQGLFVVLSNMVLSKSEVPVNTCDIRTMMWMLDPSAPSTTIATIKSAISQYDVRAGTELPMSTEVMDIQRRHVEIQKTYFTLAVNLELDQLGYSMVSLEMPLAWIIAKMHTNGFPIDVQELTKSKESYETVLSETEQALAGYATPPFNVQSHDDVRSLLFDQLRLQDKCSQSVVNLTKKRGIISTDKETLVLLSDYHPAPSLILKHRAVQKILMTYIVNLSSHAQHGIIHPHFNQEGTDTGRLSCSNPNLQNQPRRDHEHDIIDYSIIRTSFKPHPGDILVTVDYSQIEIRILAHMSGDSSLCGLLNRGGDLHRSIAAKIFGKDAEQITPTERQVGKKVIFGMIYGQGQKALASTINVSIERAAQLLQGFRRAFPGVQKWSEDVIRRCSQSGEVRTLINRLRKIKGITSTNTFERAAAVRQSINTVIQGSAADVIKMAMIAIQPVIAEYSLRLMSQVHDEVIFSVPKSSFPHCIPPIERAMENATVLNVPLKVSTSFGPNWGDLTEWVSPQPVGNTTR
eukprot:TRINITY_DN17360_c0_g1_i1.p1 TRINITY_DN17360_c0_g1~~TRINITY_DN17360_c0_g1_i1.p1  ORF type:complete len:768 (+),score=127.73 TRINITY_DN17360_c0_g1_i1:61-2304(+)